MPDTRRTPRRGPDRQARPGRDVRARSAVRRTPGGAVGGSVRPVAGAPTPKPRLTGRAAILVLVVAVLVVSYASSMRAYLQQRSQIDDLQSQIADRQASLGTLQDEQSRWGDPAYVEMRARLLGYVLPGEVPYQVQKDGRPLDAESTLGDPASIDPSTPTAWWTDAWSSVQLAGHPQTKPDPVPQTLIHGSAN